MLRGLNFRVLSLGLLGLVGLLIVGGVYLVGDNLQSKMVVLANGANNYVNKALQLDIEILNMRRMEEDFLTRADKTYLEHHSETGQSIIGALKEIEKVSSEANQQEIPGLALDLVGRFEAYQANFDKLAAARTDLGLTPDEGLEGSLRKAVHAIEAKLKESDEPKLTASMLMLRRHEKDFMLRRNVKYVEELKGAVDDFTTALNASTLSDTSKKDISALLAAYKQGFLAWSDKANEVTALQADLNAKYEEIEPLVLTMVDKIKAVADTAIQAQKAISAKTSLVITCSIAGAALVVMLLSWLVGRSIVRPLGKMTASMRALAGGNLAVEIGGTERPDEIGSMARALEVFKADAVDKKRMEVEAAQNRERAEAERIAMHEQAEAEAAERLRIATSGLAVGLKRLAAGDLSFQLTEAFAPDFEALRADFNQSVRQLGSTMVAISETVSIMDTGTREIAAGADDLSRRTEQQAASLEETAAAVDEITTNVSNSAQRTEEARSVAYRANESAKHSADVVSHAEGAMREIETSSDKISSIIGVIDEIAFQTNLLALNAGVEAARAGEAGKGFAVVAQEVRELAQRAAAAAKEIKGLIQNSSTQVKNGVKLVRDTSVALNTIGELILEINGHMDSIATSAKEQSTGLQEVNHAVNSMDQTTQQNAAMVEQSNAASSSLASEAAKLRDLISQFQLDGVATSQTGALRQTAAAMAKPSARRDEESGVARVAKLKRAANGQQAQPAWEDF